MTDKIQKNDSVNSPNHYTGVLIKSDNNNYYFEAVDLIDGILKHVNLSPEQSFSLGNALKYILRCGKKNIVENQSSEDLLKAEWYIHHVNQLRKNEN